MTHELKIQRQWADAKLAGEKPFEIRRNDRGFQKGDIVRYKVIDPKTGEPWVESGFPRVVSNENGVGKKYESGRHPLEFCDFLVTYVREGADGLEKGYCVYADCPVPRKAPEGLEGSAQVHGEAYSDGFMRITRDGLNAMEKALEEYRRTPSAGYAFPATSSASSPVSADLGSGTTPSNGTAEPLAPPPPLAES